MLADVELDTKHRPPPLQRRPRNLPVPRDSIRIDIPLEDLPDADLRCCGMSQSPKLLSFWVKVFVTIFVLGFCMYKLHKSVPCDCSQEDTVYISLISSILSFWLGMRSSGGST